MARRSIGFPLTIGITLCVVALALGVGWQLLVVSDLLPAAARGLTAWHWAMVVLGSVFFLAAAVAAYVVPDTGDPLDSSLANSGTLTGAVCFLVGAQLMLRPEAPATLAPGGDGVLPAG